MESNRTLRILALCIYSVVFATLCTFHAETAHASTLRAFEGPVRVGAFDCPPLCSIDREGNATGLIVEVLNHVAKKEKWEIKFIYGSISDLSKMLESGRIDLLAAPYTSELADSFSFTRESVMSTWAQIYSTTNLRAESMLDLASLSVGILKNDPYNGRLREITRGFNISCEFVEFNTYEEIFNALDNRWIQAGVIDRLYGIIRERDHRVKKTTIIFAPSEYRYATRSSHNEELISALDYHLDIMKNDPHSLYYELLDKITGVHIEPRVLIYLRWGLAAAGLLIFVIMLLNLFLQKQVKLKTAALVEKNIELENEIVLRKNAEEDLLRQKEYLTALHDISLALIGRLKIDDLLENILINASDLIETLHGFIYLYDDENQTLVMHNGRGIFSELPGYRQYPVAGLIGKVYESGEAMLVNDYGQWPDRLIEPALDKLNSAICIPLKLGKAVTGVIGFGRVGQSRGFNEKELEILNRFADLTTIALNNARLYSEIGEELEKRKRAERAMMDSEQRYRSVFENTGTATVIVEKDLTISMANAEAVKLLGYTPDEVVGKMKCTDFIPEDRHDFVEQITESYRQEKISTYPEYESLLLDKYGNRKDVIIKLSFIPLTDQGIISLLDITDTKKNHEDRLRLAKAIEQSTESVLITDTDLTIIYVNPIFETLTGYTVQEITGQTVDFIFTDIQDSTGEKKPISPEAIAQSWAGFIMNRKKSGELYKTDTRISPITEDSGNIINYIISQRDVSIEEQLEKQLKHVQKMEAIGTLAGGIAHDFNNILSPVIGYAEMACEEIPRESGVFRKLDKILQASHRAKELVNQILTFSRQHEQEHKPIRLSTIVKEALKLLRASIPTTIEMRNEIDQNAGLILGDITQIHQVLMNLCTNAYHAMRETGGVLTVGLENVEMSENLCKRYFGVNPGRYVKLTVHDTGHGMDQETLERVYEPFYTTKGPGEGTGLGLSIVHGIITSHDGSIHVSSKPGRGTLFEIFFPKIEEEISSPPQELKKNEGGSERILVVDDEHIVADVAAEMLKSLGYRVVIRTSSIEALETFRRAPGEFDLILTDQTMPQMTGFELAKMIRKIRPYIPIIMCTGFSDSITVERIREFDIDKLVMKPFVIKDMAAAIREALDRGNTLQKEDCRNIMPN